MIVSSCAVALLANMELAVNMMTQENSQADLMKKQGAKLNINNVFKILALVLKSLIQNKAENS